MLVKKWSEALVLYDRVLKYASEANSDAGAFENSLKVSRGPLLVSGGQGVLCSEALEGLPLLKLVLPGQPWDVVCPRVPRAAGCGTPSRILGLRRTRAMGRTASPLLEWTCSAFFRLGYRLESPGKIFKRWMSGSHPRGFWFLSMCTPR